MKLSSLMATGLLVVPLLSIASGGDGGYDENVYVPTLHVPAPELDAYAAGKLGVVSGEYFRIYRVLAWRALHGAVLTPAEVKGLELNDWRVGAVGDADDGVGTWLQARALIAPPAPPVSRFNVEAEGPDYSTYLNCASDGLKRAALTARDRLQRYGAASARIWLAGQDAVFANCAPANIQNGGGWRRPAPVLPPPAPADAPAWLHADSAYQTAAALFYAGDHVEARKRFQAIAADERSPWQPLGSYLATRCLIRQATLIGQSNSNPALAADAKRLLAEARRELVALAPRDPAAGRLLGWVDARLRPGERASELARSLQTGSLIGTERVAALSDYLRLMDSVDTADTLAESSDSMTAWIGLMQSAARPDPKPEQRSAVQLLARRHRHDDGDVAWLMPLAIQARRLGDLSVDELKAMRSLPASSPAWQTLHWHLARLELVSAQPAGTDEAIDAVLADATLAPSTRNRWLQLKMASARTVESMLAAAPRAVVEPISGAVPIPDEGKPSAVMGIDEDFARLLNSKLPLNRLAAIGARADFPASLRTSNRELVFTRALVLEDWAVADRLADDIAKPRTTTQALYRRYLAATTPRDKRLAAALILVNTPELLPGANAWNCSNDHRQELDSSLDPLRLAPVPFLSDAERATALRENAILGKTPVRSRWLADALLPWASTRPADPEAPKALHLLVASTRMECPGLQAKPGERNHSREAFELLHTLWPRSEWAAKTKYWFD